MSLRTSDLVSCLRMHSSNKKAGFVGFVITHLNHSMDMISDGVRNRKCGKYADCPFRGHGQPHFGLTKTLITCFMITFLNHSVDMA